MDFALSGIDVAIITASLGLTVVVGLWAAGASGPVGAGYFLASGKLPWYVIGAVFVSTSVSSEQIIGTTGTAYAKGMGVANWEWWALPVYTLLMLIFVPLWLRNRVATVSEFLGRRFGPLCADIYSWVMLVAYVVVFLVPVLYGGSVAVADLTGWNFYWVLWGMVVLVAIYTTKGGLSSVAWTDTLQCLLLVGGGILLFFLALAKVPGGWAAIEAASPDRMHLYKPPGDDLAPFLGFIVGTFGVFLFYSGGNQVMAQRVLAARSTWDGLAGILWAGFINLIRPLVTCFLGLIVYHLVNVTHAMPAPAIPDQTFTSALRYLAPEWGLRGIVVAGFLAAVLSTISALANSTATIFGLDVYKKLRPAAVDRELVRVGRIAALAAMVVAALIAPSVANLGGIFNYFQHGVTFLATPFISVMLLGLFWRRTNYPGAVFGLIGGSIITLLLGFGVPALAPHVHVPLLDWMAGLHWLYIGAIAQAVTMIGVVVVSLATPPQAVGPWRLFVWTPAALKEYDEGVKRPWYQSIVIWWCVYAAIWFYLYWRFW